MYQRYHDAITALRRTISRAPATAARLERVLAQAHEAIAWTVFLDVAIRGRPVELLRDVLDHAETAVALAPEQGSIRDSRGQIYLQLGRIDEALADLEKSGPLGTGYAGIFYARGRAHDSKGNRDAAIADYRKALTGYVGNDDYRKHAHSEARKRLSEMGVGEK